MTILTIHTDGGARGNPGPAGIGVHLQIKDSGWEHRYGEVIGETTNNVAEYTAVRRALELIEELRGLGEIVCDRLEFFLDSELVVKQLTGIYKIKEPSLQQLASEILIALKACGLQYSLTHVRREHNSIADSLVNAALDGKLI